MNLKLAQKKLQIIHLTESGNYGTGDYQLNIHQFIEKIMQFQKLVMHPYLCTIKGS